MARRISPSEIEELAVEAVMNPYSTLPAAGNRMWEERYERNLALGESKKGAAIHAWMHVKHYYVQDPATKKWRKRKKALPFKSKKHVTNPRKGVTQHMALKLEEGADGAIVLILFDKDKLRTSRSDGEGAVQTIYGILSLTPNWRCKGAYEVDAAAAAKGYGPLLYDLGMTVAQDHGAPGVIPDRDKVSEAAATVWKYASSKRQDIKIARSGILCPAHGRTALDRIYALKQPFPQTQMLLTRGKSISKTQVNKLTHMVSYFWKCMYFGKCPAKMPKRISAVAGGPQKEARANPRKKQSKRKKNPVNVRTLVAKALR